jgi:hypothetical protein
MANVCHFPEPVVLTTKGTRKITSSYGLAPGMGRVLPETRLRGLSCVPVRYITGWYRDPEVWLATRNPGGRTFSTTLESSIETAMTPE